MQITQTLHVTTREEWRKWLEENHDQADEIWLIYHNKKSGKPRIAYEEAVEEALCFGWIDSIIKSIDEFTAAQRYTPRRKKSILSETNKCRVQKLLAEGKMKPDGIESIRQYLDVNDKGGVKVKFEPLIIPPDILEELQQDATVWNNFQKFPEHYIRIRLNFIEVARPRPEIFRQRLDYFLKMTAKNQKYGQIQ